MLKEKLFEDDSGSRAVACSENNFSLGYLIAPHSTNLTLALSYKGEGIIIKLLKEIVTNNFRKVPENKPEDAYNSDIYTVPPYI